MSDGYATVSAIFLAQLASRPSWRAIIDTV
jgi:hypothetical protein